MSKPSYVLYHAHSAGLPDPPGTGRQRTIGHKRSPWDSSPYGKSYRARDYFPTMCSMPLLFSMQTNSSISASGSSRGWRTIRHGFV